jgi:hypothetical protein
MESGNDYRAAAAVVAGMANVLEVDRYEDAAPRMQRVVGFEDLLRVVVEPAFSEDKPLAAEGVGLLVHPPPINRLPTIATVNKIMIADALQATTL